MLYANIQKFLERKRIFIVNYNSMRLTEEQLKQLVMESAKKVVLEYSYHEKQNQPSEEEHEAWIRRKSAAKKREMERQRKENGDDKSDSKAIDYYDYKHGKGNFPVMTKESKVRMSASEFQKFITESVKRVINEMSEENPSLDETRLD